MNKLILLTDGSVNPRTNVGYGAYLSIKDCNQAYDSLKKLVQVKRFDQTSSTKLELQTLIWALSDIQTTGFKLVIYTDSQNIIELPERRHRLELNNYRSNKNKRLNNDQLYQQFYKILDQLDYRLIKVRGHKASDQKNDMDRLFTLVDKASRNALRTEFR